jgi:predicted Zn-dependent peptidase
MIESTQFTNGVNVVTKRLPGHHSIALGVWILNGSRHETAAQRGYAHFLEHLFFKGTTQLDGPSLALRIESMGGQVNAHTGREVTALHGLVPKGDIRELMQILSDMVCHPRFIDQDVAMERHVILQEMAMIEDNPEEALEDRAMSLALPDHPLGQAILGHSDVIKRADAAALREYMHSHIRGGRIWVVAVGDVEHNALIATCHDLASLPTGNIAPQTPPKFTPGVHPFMLNSEQSHLMWLMPIPPASDDDFHAHLIANQVLGGGVSSRLFQELRERRGLVYGVQSRLEHYSDCGIWSINTACDPRHVDACRDIVSNAIERLVHEGVDQVELDISRRHLGAGMSIDEDNPDSVMERLAREAIYLQHHPDISEFMNRLNMVTTEASQAALATAWERHLYTYTICEPKNAAALSHH